VAGRIRIIQNRMARGNRSLNFGMAAGLAGPNIFDVERAFFLWVG